MVVHSALVNFTCSLLVSESRKLDSIKTKRSHVRLDGLVVFLISQFPFSPPGGRGSISLMCSMPVDLKKFEKNEQLILQIMFTAHEAVALRDKNIQSRTPNDDAMNGQDPLVMESCGHNWICFEKNRYHNYIVAASDVCAVVLGELQILIASTHGIFFNVHQPSPLFTLILIYTANAEHRNSRKNSGALTQNWILISKWFCVCSDNSYSKTGIWFLSNGNYSNLSRFRFRSITLMRNDGHQRSRTSLMGRNKYPVVRFSFIKLIACSWSS